MRYWIKAVIPVEVLVYTDVSETEMQEEGVVLTMKKAVLEKVVKSISLSSYTSSDRVEGIIKEDIEVTSWDCLE
jgi:hypothetical protein